MGHVNLRLFHVLVGEDGCGGARHRPWQGEVPTGGQLLGPRRLLSQYGVASACPCTGMGVLLTLPRATVSMQLLLGTVPVAAVLGVNSMGKFGVVHFPVLMSSSLCQLCA